MTITKPCFIFTLILLMLKISEQQPTSSDSCLVYYIPNTPSGSGVCLQCLQGFYLQFFFCIPCNPLCQCTANTTYCDSCINVTYQNRTYQSYRRGDVCILCNTTIPFCAECPSDGLNCTRCIEGRFITKDGFCSNYTCTSNCQLCKNQTACRVCAPGYFLYQNQTCTTYNCTDNCYTCLDNTTCSQCMIGHFLQPNGTCNNCTYGCAKCTDDINGTCQVCLPSFFLINDTCYEGTPYCLYYSGDYQSGPVCLICLPGFFNSGGSCSPCYQAGVSGCILCSQQFVCLSPCLQGYVPFNFACVYSKQSFNIYSIALIIFLVTVSLI